MKQPRFEVVRADAGWFARFIAANGKEIWRTSETYGRERGALRAVRLVGETHAPCICNDATEIRHLDEREAQP